MSVTIPQHVIIFLFGITRRNKPLTLMAQTFNSVTFPQPLLNGLHEWFSRDRGYAMIKLFMVPGVYYK
jgi:hypothetical protein